VSQILQIRRPKYATPSAVPSSLKYRAYLSLQGSIYPMLLHVSQMLSEWVGFI